MADLKISLRACRINAGMTQQEVADELKVSRITVMNWENGTTSPAFYTVKLLSDLYNVPMDNIFLPMTST